MKLKMTGTCPLTLIWQESVIRDFDLDSLFDITKSKSQKKADKLEAKAQEQEKKDN